jgi:hypothetical protein
MPDAWLRRSAGLRLLSEGPAESCDAAEDFSIMECVSAAVASEDA